MATNVVIADGIQPSSTSVTTLYTSPSAGGGTRIIAFTAANPTGVTATYSVWIVPSGSSADNTNKILPSTSLAASEPDSPPELQNHLIPAGGSLQVQVGTATSINFRVTGIAF